MRHRKLPFGKFWVLLIAVLMAIPITSHATHIIGGEMLYRCLGNNQYEITLNVYRDCYYGAADAPFDDPASIGIFDFVSGTFINELKVPFVRDDTIRSYLFDPCYVVPPTVCVHTTTYRDTLQLNYRPGGYYIVYQRCCRNETINNIQNPVKAGATYYIHLTEKALRECNTSPVFKEWPPVFICAGTEIQYDHSAYDAEGDSLVYKIFTPYTGASFGFPMPQPPNPPPYDTVKWVAPTYSRENVFGVGRPMSIDMNTGWLTGRPDLQGQYVVGVCVFEYRNGELMSHTFRDFQYNVGLCGQINAAMQAPDVLCDNRTVQFQNLSQYAKNFKWYFDFPDTTISSTAKDPVYVFPDTGLYTVALIAEPTSACSDTFVKTIFLQDNSIQANFNVLTFDCIDTTVISVTDLSIDNVSPISKRTWSLRYRGGVLTDSGLTPIFLVPGPDTVELRLDLESVNGCKQSLVKRVPIGTSDPGANISDTLRICEGETVELNPGGNTNYQYQWTPTVGLDDPTSPNPKASPTTTTKYRVKITIHVAPCEVLKEVVVIVEPKPQLAFDTRLDCDFRTIHFNNTSITGVNDFIWTFGDPSNPGATSRQRNPSYTYPGPGTYPVKLFLGPSSSCADTLSRNVVVDYRVLDADFDFEYLTCEPGALTIQFRDRSTNNINNTTTWNWTFSNGTTSASPTPQVLINNSQLLVAKLLIRTADGCLDSLQKSISIKMVEQFPPDVQLMCPGDSRRLNPNANPDYRYEWIPATGLDDPFSPNPLATLTQSQQYVVKISAFGSDTCEVQWNVFVEVPPAFNLQTSGDKITCDPTTTIQASSNAGNLTWRDGNGNVIGTGASISVPVSGISNYTVRADDAYGCTEEKSVRIAGGPLDITFPPDQKICKGEPFNVSIVNRDLNDDLIIRWTAPPGLIASGANTPTPVINEIPGRYIISVDVASTFNCTFTDTMKLVIVDTAMRLGFDFYVQCDGLTVDFRNKSVNAFDYVWNFGDPTTTADVSTVTNPTYTFPDTGTYFVMLTIAHDVSCTDTVIVPVTLKDIVLTADFGYEFFNCSEQGVNVQFYNRSFSLQNNITGYKWLFSGYPSSTAVNPVLPLTQSDTFTVRLIVENAIGCFDSLDQTVYVDLLRLNLPDTLVQCKGDEVYLNPVFNPRYQYLWSPANKVDDPRSPNPKAVTNETTTFTVVIQSISSDTCEAVRQVHLIVPQLISLRATGDTITCGYPIDLRASGNGQLTYTWRNSAGNVVGRTNTLRVNPTNSETFTVEAEDIYGCSESASMTVTNRQVDISAAGEIEACENGPATLSVRNLDAGDNLTYSWSPLNRIISGANTPNPVVRTDVSGLNVFFVYAQNQFGCRDTASVGLDVREFNPTYTPQTEVCPGVPTPINPGFSPDQTYTWSPAANLSNPNAANPVATLTQTTFFDVIIRQAIDTLSCVDTVRVKVDVRPPLDLRVPADTTICRQELLKLVASASGSGLNYVWSDQANFSNVLGTQAELFVSREGSHVYYVRVIDDLGCADTGQVRVNIVPIEIKLQDDTFTCRNVVSRLQVDNLNPDQTLRYSWSPLRYIVSGATTSNPEIKLDQTTTLTLQVQNQYNCSATFNFLIGVVDLDAILTIDAKPDSVLPGESSQLTLLPQDRDFSYQWTPSSTLNNITIFNPIATPEVTTTYTVEVEDENGCVASRSVTVIVYDPLCIDPYIFLPSAFSPNGDGTNDVLYLLGKYVEEMHLVIYNRWGQKVFESFKQTEGWDGTFKGELLSPDVYGFYLTVKCIDGEEYFKKGNISLLR